MTDQGIIDGFFLFLGAFAALAFIAGVKGSMS